PARGPRRVGLGHADRQLVGYPDAAAGHAVVGVAALLEQLQRVRVILRHELALHIERGERAAPFAASGARALEQVETWRHSLGHAFTWEVERAEVLPAEGVAGRACLLEERDRPRHVAWHAHAVQIDDGEVVARQARAAGAARLVERPRPREIGGAADAVAVKAPQDVAAFVVAELAGPGGEVARPLSFFCAAALEIHGEEKASFRRALVAGCLEHLVAATPIFGHAETSDVRPAQLGAAVVSAGGARRLEQLERAPIVARHHAAGAEHQT